MCAKCYKFSRSKQKKYKKYKKYKKKLSKQKIPFLFLEADVDAIVDGLETQNLRINTISHSYTLLRDGPICTKHPPSLPSLRLYRLRSTSRRRASTACSPSQAGHAGANPCSVPLSSWTSTARDTGTGRSQERRCVKIRFEVKRRDRKPGE